MTDIKGAQVQADETSIPWYMNFSVLFIILGVAGFGLMWWFSAGQPGRSLADGIYSCKSVDDSLATFNQTAAYVDNGHVVDASYIPFASTMETFVPFSNVQQLDSSALTMRSVNGLTGATETMTCRLNW